MNVTPILALVLAVQAQTQQPGLATLPHFRATDVRVVRDTAWFFTRYAAEGVASYPLVGFVPATRAWITTARRWPDVVSISATRERSGSARVFVNRDEPLDSSSRLVLTNDPRTDVGTSYLVQTAASRIPLRLTLTEDERRRLYRAGHGSWPDRLPPPLFRDSPTRWARDGFTWAFAFAGSAVRVGEASSDASPPWLGALLAVDGRSGRLTPLVHPALIGVFWTGLESVGGSVFAAPSTNEKNHRAGDRDVTRLARYDFARGTWRLYGAPDLPTGAGRIHAVASDSGHLFVAAATGLATLHVASGRWETRFYDDTSVVLPDGADSLVTRLASTAPRAAPSIVSWITDSLGTIDESAADSLATMATFLDEIGPRRRRAFAATVSDLIPFDTIRMIVDADRYDDRGNEMPAIVLMGGTELAARVIGRREFLPFLREAMWNADTQRFALLALERIGPAEVREALRATLDSGTAMAGLGAAASLAHLGEPDGVRRLRAHMLRPGDPVNGERRINGSPWSLGTRAMIALGLVGDTASLPAMLALVPKPTGTEPYEGLAEVMLALTQFPTGEGRRAVATAVEARPWLWNEYIEVVGMHSKLSNDPDITAAIARIRARQRAVLP